MVENVTIRVDLISRESEYNSAADITEWVLGIPRFTDTGLEDINSAHLILDSPFGEFLTREESGAPPIIRDNDHFRIRCTAENGTQYDREFEYAPMDGALVVDETAERGRIINLKLLGIEYHTQKITYAATHRWSGGREVLDDIVSQYNNSRGSNQPALSIERGQSDIPEWTRNTYPYETPRSVHDRLRDLALSFGAPVSGGGVLDFFTLGFDTGGDSFNTLVLRSFTLGYSRGNAAAVSYSIRDGTLVADDDKKQSGLSPAVANRIVGLFDSDAGSLPAGAARIRGLINKYNLLPVFNRGVTYPVGAEVRASGDDAADRGPVYRARREVSGQDTSNSSFWEPIPYRTYVGGFQYSPWTDDKGRLWQNSGVASGRSGPMRNTVPDFNNVVKTGTYWQVPVDIVSASPNLPINITYPGRTPYRGLTVLARDGSGEWARFKDKIIMYDGERWIVKYPTIRTGYRVLDEYRGFVFEWSGSKWDLTSDYDAYSHLHPPDTIGNDFGMVAPAPAGNTRTAISAVWTLQPTNGVIGTILGALGSLTQGIVDGALNFLVAGGQDEDTGQQGAIRRDPQLLKWGQSLRIKFPYPCNTSGGISEDVGALYGGTRDNPEPATIDIINGTYTRNGKQGFNNDQSEDLGRLGAISFGIEITHLLGETGRTTQLNRAPEDRRTRLSIRDIFDNVVINDFDVPFSGKFELLTIPFSTFRPYVAHAPRNLFSFIIPPPELEQANNFRWDAIKDITWTILQPYDAEGRFNPIEEAVSQAGADLFSFFRTFGRALTSAFGINGPSRVQMKIDNLHFTKELVAVSPPDAAWNQERTIRVPDIFNYEAARNYVLSEQERAKFPKMNFNLSIRGDFTLRYGAGFNYVNDRVVSAAAGTVRLAAQHIEHSWTSDGLRTNILAGRRFTA